MTYAYLISKIDCHGGQNCYSISEYFTFVWINALLIYVTGTKFLTDQFDEYLPADIHVTGKDILNQLILCIDQ